MINTGTGEKNIFSQVGQIRIADVHTQAFGYFGMQVIGNLKQSLLDPLEVSALLKLSNDA